MESCGCGSAAFLDARKQDTCFEVGSVVGDGAERDAHGAAPFEALGGGCLAKVRSFGELGDGLCDIGDKTKDAEGIREIERIEGVGGSVILGMCACKEEQDRDLAGVKAGLIGSAIAGFSEA